MRPLSGILEIGTRVLSGLCSRSARMIHFDVPYDHQQYSAGSGEGRPSLRLDISERHLDCIRQADGACASMRMLSKLCANRPLRHAPSQCLIPPSTVGGS